MSSYVFGKDGERLEALFYEHHGVSDTRYREFCEKNIHVLHKDTLESGDKVYLLETQVETLQALSEERRVALW